MSFLDATGLGTFWAKLKNYFVPTTSFHWPVSEELTDLIVPENLVPNSLFSDKETSIISIQNKSYNGLTTTSNTNISPTTYAAWYFVVHNIRISAATVSVVSSSLSVTFTVEEIAESGSFVGFKTVNLVAGSYSALTHGANLLSLSDNTLNFGPYNAETETTTYSTGGITEAGRVTKVSTAKFCGVGVKGFNSSHVGKTITFSFKNPFFYRGGFKAPSFVESGDKTSTRRYAIPSLFNVEHLWNRKVVTMGGSHYFGLFSMSQGASVYFAYKSGEQNAFRPDATWEIYKVNMYYFYNYNLDKNNKKTWIGRIDAECLNAKYNTAEDNFVKHFKFRTSASGSVWGAVYITDTAEKGTLLMIDIEHPILSGISLLNNTGFATLLDSGSNTSNASVGNIVPDYSKFTIFKSS